MVLEMMHKLDNRMQSIESGITQISTMSADIQTLISQNSSQAEEILDLKCRMRDNLVFWGIPKNYNIDTEPNPTTDIHEQALRTFLTQHLETNTDINANGTIKINDIHFHRVHMIGGPSRNSQPRPMVAKFERYSDRELIRNAGIKLNMKHSGYYINEQFPPEIDERRRQLL
ncbi:hypothetical protein MAR_032106 [Mya arenaria]|uniref:Uncharacterized protein n=1 Tax=Mya arenaria TaxID=6604 RepID=A0ABY7F5Q2_MYAAR|nr:hypothetical protein MAR_032106 [Mya arenaria]